MSLMNTQYDSIMRMYAARQARSRQEYEERMEQIQKDVPELAPLDADITACQAALVRSAVEENPARRADLKSRLKNLQEQRNALLSAHGLDPGLSGTGLCLPGLQGHRLHRFRQVPLLFAGGN